MKHKIINFTLVSVFILLQTSTAFSQKIQPNDWSQFRGNLRNGISTETGIIDKWSDKGPKLLWKKDLGDGFTEVTAVGNQIYTMYSKKENKKGHEYIAAFDKKTGKELWSTEVDSIFIDVDDWGDGPRATQAVDDKNLYCLSSFGKLLAVSRKDGKILWKVDVLKDFEARLPRWAYSTSPLLINNTIILETCSTGDKFMAAFDKNTGKTKWTKGNGTETYSSPLAVKIDNKNNIVIANSTNLISFDEKGDTLWKYQLPLRAGSSMPMFISPNKFFVSNLGETGSVLVEVNGTEVKELFKNSTMKSNWSSSCHYKGYIYGFSNSKLQCISIETGETKWGKRGLGKGSLILVDNKLLVLSDKGILKLVDTNPDIYTEISSFQALDGKSWTAPSFSNGLLFLRNLTQMACYKLKK